MDGKAWGEGQWQRDLRDPHWGGYLPLLSRDESQAYFGSLAPTGSHYLRGVLALGWRF